MVPKIIAKGKSFKGAALYLLHDKGRVLSSERVAWTETRNLAVDDPQLGWKIMAATAMDQERLKDNAGIKSTGRKSDKAVLHLSLAWHPDEKEHLTREEMVRAASEALKAIGADDRQAISIAHNDEAHPHLHILCNRVSPDDGRMLPSSKDRLHLSRWAESYEKERGKVLCEERVKNNEARDNGEYKRAEKDLSRNQMWNRPDDKTPANDNRDIERARRDARRQVDAALSKEKREMQARHEAEWQRFTDRYKQRRANLRVSAKERKAHARQSVRDSYLPSLRDLDRRHTEEWRQFKEQEKNLGGTIRNMREAFEISRLTKDSLAKRVKDGISIVLGAEGREKVLYRRQRSERLALLKSMKAEKRLAIGRIKVRRLDVETRLRDSFFEQRDKLIARQRQEKSALRGKWRDHHAQLKREWHDPGRKQELKSGLQWDFDGASRGADGQSKEEKKARILKKLREGRDKSRSPRDR